MSEKSLQINIGSIEDAKSIVQNLAKIKLAYEAHGCTSIELAIMEEAVTPSAAILVGAFPWCVVYRKIVKPFEGNVFYPLPHLREVAATGQPFNQRSSAPAAVATAPVAEPVAPAAEASAAAPAPTLASPPPDYHFTAKRPGKSPALVQPERARAS